VNALYGNEEVENNWTYMMLEAEFNTLADILELPDADEVISEMMEEIESIANNPNYPARWN